MDENKEGLVPMQPTNKEPRTLRDMIKDASAQGKNNMCYWSRWGRFG